MKKLEIGGYLGLDVRQGRHFHEEGRRYNTARSALISVCKALREAVDRPLTLLLPRFNCPDVAEALEVHTDVEMRFYGIDGNLEPILPEVDTADSIYYFINLFGLKSASAARLPENSIVDNVHAFFSPAVDGMHTLYSARKFFGVPDGAYLYSDLALEVPPAYVSWEESAYLLQRLDVGAPAGYAGFQRAEHALSGSPVRGMSALSQALLGGLDYEGFARQRRENFEYLHDAIGAANELAPVIDQALSDKHFVPLCYPHLREDGERVRSFLIAEGVFVPRYWAGISDDSRATPFERHLAKNCLHLPIDHRYGRADMDEIVARIKIA
ncbi:MULTISPECIES: hypothetical protein [unclassified Burkholderia]|uniref:hypothetical protein n=1 Tax=unclassified Burkholderia TaxID=2613784 RepID=UPI002AB25E4F|nr:MULTISPECIES: hypothetical protein [unclassified Burkholderia]